VISLAAIQDAIRELSVEREALYARCAGHAELEDNRRELMRLRRELAHAVVAVCLRRR